MASFLLGTSLISPLSLADVDPTQNRDLPENTNYLPTTVVTEDEDGYTLEVTEDTEDSDSHSATLFEEEDSAIYFGFEQPFDGFALEFEEEGRNGGFAAEYWDGNSWESFGAHFDFGINGGDGLSVNWDRPSDWDETQLELDLAENGDRDERTDSLYFARLRVFDAFDDVTRVDLAGLTVYNLVLELEAEGREEIDEDIEDIEFDYLGGDGSEDFYAYRNMGNGEHAFAMDAGDGTDYEVTITIDGYVEETVDADDIDETQTVVSVDDIEYAYLAIIEDEDGDEVENARVYAGEDEDVRCDDLGDGEYGCPVSIDEDYIRIKISDNNFDTVRDRFDDERNNHDDDQVRQVFEIDEDVDNDRNDDDDEVDGIDLRVEEIRLNSRDELIIELENVGDESVDYNDTVVVDVYVDDRLEWTETFRNRSSEKNWLDAGRSSSYNLGDDFFDRGRSSYDIEVEVDAEDDVREERENNNTEKERVRLDGSYDGGRYGDENPFLIESPDCDDYSSPFIDIRNHFSECEVDFLYDELRAIDGRSDRHFFPNSYVTRAEFLKMALEMAEYDVFAVNSVYFNDVQRRDWYHEYVSFAAHYGFIDRGSYFRPNDPINRAEALVLIMRIAGENNWEYDYEDIEFWDVSSWNWYAYAVVSGWEDGLIEGYRDGSFRGNSNIARGEAAVLIYRAYIAYID